MTLVFKVLISISIFCVAYNYLTRNYAQKYPTILYFGLKGSGKTTTLTKIALSHIKKGITVYSNVPIPGTIMFDAARLGYFNPQPNSVILIDEIGIIFNNRNFADAHYRDQFAVTNKFLKYARQCRCTVYMFTQIFDEMDKKIRGLLDGLYQCKCIGRVFVISRKINKSIAPSDDESDIIGRYRYAGLIGGIQFTFVPRYVQFFESFNPPDFGQSTELERIPITPVQSQSLTIRGWLHYKLYQVRFLQMPLYRLKLFRYHLQKRKEQKNIRACLWRKGSGAQRGKRRPS